MNKDPLKVLESCHDFLKGAKDVYINSEDIKEATLEVEKRIEKGLPAPTEEHLTLGDPVWDTQIVFLENVVNFCFWAEKGQEKWHVEHLGKTEDGASGLPIVFKRALDEGLPILDAKYIARLSLKDTKHLFRPSNEIEIPLLKERQENLNEAGRILLKKYDGKYYNLLNSAKFDAIEITKLTIKNFNSFNDKSNGVKFYKRAQLNTYDLSQIKGFKDIKNIQDLTAMADYKLPQILRHLQVIKYSKALSEKVDNFKLIPKGSKEELEIRAATVLAIDQISKNLNITAGLADRAIWWMSREETIEEPYHRTYSIYY